MVVDVVLTDADLWLDQGDQLQKRFDACDGLGLILLQQEGIQMAF